MKQTLTTRPWARWGILAGAGAALWAALYLGASAHARSSGLPLWETVVTWDEWVAAIGLLPGVMLFVFGVRSADDVESLTAKKMIRITGQVSVVLLVLFLLDLVARAVLGLGWKPF